MHTHASVHGIYTCSYLIVQSYNTKSIINLLIFKMHWFKGFVYIYICSYIYCYSYLCTWLCAHAGLEKNNNVARNKWDSSKDILEKEYKIDKLKIYTRTKRKYELANPIHLLTLFLTTHFRQKDDHY